VTLQEAAAVLATAAAFDRRTVGEVDVRAWAEVLSDVSVADALAGVKEHYANTSDFLMPADVRRVARRRVRERLEATAVPPVPAEIADDGRLSVEWHRARLAEIKAGTFVAPPEPVVAPRLIRQLLSGLGRLPVDGPGAGVLGSPVDEHAGGVSQVDPADSDGTLAPAPSEGESVLAGASDGPFPPPYTSSHAGGGEE
jgi:hypothetical protein